MLEIIFALIFVVLLFAFAFYGFVCFIKTLIQGGKPDSTSDVRPKRPRSLADDVLGTSHLLNYLRNKSRIDDKTYWRLRGFLEEEFRQHELAQSLPETSKLEPQELLPTKTIVDEHGELRDVEVSADDRFGRAAPPIHSVEDSPVITDVEVVQSPLSVRGEDSEVPASHLKPVPTPAPWELPDPPAREPRRTFGEMMAGFMLEKNIRWGELASGILIVGSAVGLVVSLRNELRDTIPYFSALLFMLITAAIHGAGIYTLKKWKLRATSRGTLLIGLLLIPLNIIAACILSGNETDRRELSDPLLWIAIIVGLSSFAAMTWFSSKCLFRRGQLPLVIAVMGCAIGTLVINRVNVDDDFSLRKLLLSLPMAASFLIGTAAFYKRQWERVRWSERSANRLFVFLGLSTFAFMTAASLLIVRAEDKSEAVVMLLPAFSLVALMTTWLGRIIWKRAGGVEERRLMLTGLTLHIFGLSLLVISLIVSASYPTILLVNSAFGTIGLILFARHQQEPWLLPAAWAALATFVLCAVNLCLGKLNWDVWATAQDLGRAALSGESGLSLLAAGTGVAGLHALSGGRVKDPSRFRRFGSYSGAAIFLVGCLLALAASFVNPSNIFDNQIATALLGLASVLAVVVCVQMAAHSNSPNRLEHQVAKALPHGTAIILFGFLAHACIWNQLIRNALNQVLFGINANWVFVFTIHAILLAIVAGIARYKMVSSSANSIAQRELLPDLLGEWSAITSVFAFVGIFFLIQFQTGLATAIGVSLSLAWFMLVWVQDDHRFGHRYWFSCLVGSTFVTAFVAVSELTTRLEWCPTYESPRFWLIQVIALSFVAVGWLLVSMRMRSIVKLRKFVDFEHRVERVLVHGLALLTNLIAATALVGGVTCELFVSSNEPLLSLTHDRMWVFGALGVVGFALLTTAFQRPSMAAGVGLVLTWLMTWGFGADYFAGSKTVGSAIRWLLPIGGIVGAVLVASRKPFRPAWAAARNRMGLAGRSSWPAATTQGLIILSLTVVVVSVLLISTIAIAQVLMTGSGAALGGPLSGSWFDNLNKDVSYGVPVGIIVGTFLLYAVSERRKWLATAGSAVFQYCVVLAVILLFVSPHPQLASIWFVNILQSVSIGMTGYGIVWWFFKERIEGRTGPIGHRKTASGIPQIEIHTLINGLLITSLAVLVIGRFYLLPDRAGDWINTVGGPLGVVAWALFGVLAFFVWREKLNQPHRTSTWMWLACWSGLVLVGMVAAAMDRHDANTGNTVPWRTFGAIMWGGILVCLSQVALLWLERRPESLPVVYSEEGSDWFTIARSNQTLPLLFTGWFVLAFAIRGLLGDVLSFWSYYTAIGLVLVFVVIAGLMRRSTGLSFVAMALTTFASFVLVDKDPAGWFPGVQPYYVNVTAIALVVLALVWSGFYIYRSLSKGEAIRSSFVWMPNWVLLLSSISVLLGALAEWIIEISFAAPVSCLNNPMGISAIIAPVILSVLHLWNDHRKFQVLSRGLWLVGVTVFVIAITVPNAGMKNASILLGLGYVVTIWGLVWTNRKSYFGIANRFKAPALIRLERSMEVQLPIMACVLGCIVLLWSFVAILLIDPRTERYMTAMSPFPVAVGLGLMSNANQKRWRQLLALTLVTLGAVFVAWADLSPARIHQQPMSLFVRALLVFAGSMFIYGGLVSRWVRENDTWLKSLREMAVATCGLAVLCFGLVMWQELIQFQPEIGCGMPLPEAVAVAVVVLGMILGLILIAVLPKTDPFSLSIAGRMGYVYAAQLVVAMLVAHLYLTMPKLFAFGIKDYWPYIAMILCFGGVGVAQVLEKRQLAVLGQPLFNSAAALPLVVAVCIWGVDSKADAALVMLTVGLAYLMISYTHQSILSGAAAIVFGNIALWLFYDKFDGFAFVEHPQLWLIPPALSVLVAAQISRSTLTRGQLALVRYVCVTVIYLSSTSEIFISGLGQKLWPPMVLALLAVGGIMAGILIQVRAYLYLGSVFLLLAMISMVSHAQQRLEHVWPWWAFGIGLGVSILVMFGVFEKRKKDMKQIVGRLSEWDL